MSPEEALVSAADGDFGLLMIAVLLIFVLAICGALIRWIMSTIPQQMERDRMAMCDQIRDLISTIREAHTRQDERSKEILDTTKRIESMILGR